MPGIDPEGDFSLQCGRRAPDGDVAASGTGGCQMAARGGREDTDRVRGVTALGLGRLRGLCDAEGDVLRVFTLRERGRWLCSIIDAVAGNNSLIFTCPSLLCR